MKYEKKYMNNNNKAYSHNKITYHKKKNTYRKIQKNLNIKYQPLNVLKCH